MSGSIKLARGSRAIRRGQSNAKYQNGAKCPPRHFSKHNYFLRIWLYFQPALLIDTVQNLCKWLTRLPPDPACGTCRKKCRKCDRTRPICNRCKAKGLHCEGYPPRFQFCGLATTDAENVDSPAPAPAPALLPASSPASTPGDQVAAIVSPSETPGLRSGSLSSFGASPFQGRPPPPIWETDSSASPQDIRAIETPSPASDARLLDDMLLSGETQKLLKYCEPVLLLGPSTKISL